jgi:ferredoxin
MPAPPAGKLPKDYDKLPVPQPQARASASATPSMLAIIDPDKCFGRGCEYCVAVCPVPELHHA